MINTKATNTELEATALSEVLEANIAYLANHREVVQKVVETLHVAVDGGLLLVRKPWGLSVWTAALSNTNL